MVLHVVTERSLIQSRNKGVDRLNEVLTHVGNYTAHGGRNAWIARDNGAGDPDLVQHRACVESTAAAEGHKRKALRIEAALDTDQPYRTCHARVRDPQNGLCRFQCGKTQWFTHMIVNCGGRGLNIQSIELAANRIVRVDAAQYHIGVSHRRTVVAQAVGHGPWVRACAFGADIQ